MTAATLHPLSASVTDEGDPRWKPLRFFNVYRSIVSGLFMVLVFWDVAPRPLGDFDHRLFEITTVLYFLFSTVCAFTIQFRWPRFDTQVVTQVFTDIVAITVLMHASGGVSSGMGLLLVVAVAGGSLLMEGRIAILFAAVATLAVLGDQIYVRLIDPVTETNYHQAGMLGVALFATAYASFALARRVRASEALVARREVDLANLAQLNEHIIQRMQSGILALDPDDRIRLLNESARRLLGLPASCLGERLAQRLPELAALLERWRGDMSRSTYLHEGERLRLTVMVSFSAIGAGAADGVLVYLEDASAMTQRAQQLKLASLGRLTASIAHEIRNPLGAISHAGQLLAEAERADPGDRRLTQIIRDNCARVNVIVENVLQLSRRNVAVSESVELLPWLQEFASELVAGEAGGSAVVPAVDVSVEPPGMYVRVDPTQLRQVLSNLCENALRHAVPAPHLWLRAGVATESGRPYLDVMDNGPGIPTEVAEHVFEPFYTTRIEGTGLGLYLARELCEGNQAMLNLMSREQGCRFRITFADPRRQEVPVS